MVKQMDDAREALVRYESSRDPALLRLAGEKLEGVDLFAVQGSEQRARLRVEVATVWMYLLASVDAAKDPRFDPGDPPQTRVTPPSAPGRPTYPPGTDPARIADPAQRAEYEQALERNRRKTLLAERHWEVEAIDLELTEGARRFVQRFYTSAPVDQSELQAVMERTRLSPRRRQAIAAWVR